MANRKTKLPDFNKHKAGRDALDQKLTNCHVCKFGVFKSDKRIFKNGTIHAHCALKEYGIVVE